MVEVFVSQAFKCLNIFITMDTPAGTHLARVAADGRLEFELVDLTKQQKPTLELGHAIATELANQLSNMGVRTDQDAKIEGTLNATRYHLEDLRQLLKIKDPTK